MPRNKETRDLIKKIKAAGGAVEDRGHGKIRVTGPKGTAYIGDSIAAGRAMKEARSNIKKYAGLDIE